MKMFLTRIGFGSRAVVTGDLTQTDLPTGRMSGLQHAQLILRGVSGAPLPSSMCAMWCGTNWCSGSCKPYESHEMARDS